MQPLRHNHQVGKTHVQIEKLFKRDPWDRRSAIQGIVVFVPFSGLAPFEAKLRKVDRPSALMRRTHVAPPEGRNKRE